MTNLEINNENLSLSEKEELKSFFEQVNKKVKSKEEINGLDLNLEDKINSLSAKIENIETKSEANDLLNDLQSELLVLKDYKEFKDLIEQIDRKLEDEKRKISSSYKSELSNLAGNIVNSDLSAEEIKSKADKGRRKAANEIEEGIVAKLSERNDWIGKLAKKAMGK